MSTSVLHFLEQNSSDVFCHVTADHVVRYVSRGITALLGFQPEDIVGQPSSFPVFEEDLPLLARATRQVYELGDRNPATQLRMRRRDGSLVWVETTARPMYDSTGSPTGAALVIRDVTERKQAEERLAELALTDGLTGLSNRRTFDATLEHEWQRTLREGTQLSLLLLDVDFFKQFNDLYGHQVGDDCLRTVANVLRARVRAADMTARYGGEEFAVILPGADAKAAARIADDMLADIRNLAIPHAHNPAGRVTASIGAATALARIGGTMRMPESLLQAADIALYKAKHSGRNRTEAHLLIAPKAA